MLQSQTPTLLALARVQSRVPATDVWRTNAQQSYARNAAQVRPPRRRKCHWQFGASKTSMDPIVPLYQRNNNLTRVELMEAAEKELSMNPFRTWDHEALSDLARKAFARNQTDFTRWSDEELKSYANPDDDLWRAIEMGHVQQKAADLMDDAQLPVYHRPRNLNEPQDTEFHLPIFLRSMDLEYIVKKRWIRLMKMTKKVLTNYISQTDHFVFPPVQPSTLGLIWTKITAHKSYYIYKIPRPLRRASSMPDLQQGFRRRRRLNDDQDTTNLGFGLHDLPARLPPRLHHGKPPAYPLEKDHPLCPLKNGPIISLVYRDRLVPWQADGTCGGMHVVHEA